MQGGGWSAYEALNEFEPKSEQPEPHACADELAQGGSAWHYSVCGTSAGWLEPKDVELKQNAVAMAGQRSAATAGFSQPSELSLGAVLRFRPIRIAHAR